MASAWTQFLSTKKNLIGWYTHLCLGCLLLVMPVSSITAAREFFTFMTLGGVLLLLLSRARKISLDPIWFLWLAFFLTALLSLLSAVDFDYSLNCIRRDLLKGTLMFFIGLYALTTAGSYRQIWRILLVGLAFMSVCGVVAFIPHISLDKGFHFISYGRASSLSMGYGHFASYLAIMAPYLLLAPRAFSFKNKAVWLIWGLALLFVLAAAYFTSTRILWASLLLSGILYFWFTCRRRLLVAAAGAVLGAALLAALVMLPQHSHGEKWSLFWGDPEKMQGTAGDLAMLWGFSFEKLSKSPFKGAGFGKESFNKAYPDFIADKNHLLRHTHNVFVDYAMQMGVQGLLAFLLLLLALLKGLYPHPPPARGNILPCFRLATFIMVFSYVLRSQVDEYFVDDGLLLFWLLMGLAWGTRYLVPEPDPVGQAENPAAALPAKCGPPAE